MVDEDGGPTVVEIGHQRDDAPVCRPHWSANLPGEVNAPVTAAEHLVEHARHSEHAGHRASTRAHERDTPEPRRLVRPLSHPLHETPRLWRDRKSTSLNS